MSVSNTSLRPGVSAPQARDGSSPTCELCGDHRFEPVSSRDRRGQPLETVICTGCGLVSHQNIPQDAELDAYYAAEYRQQYHGEAAPSPRRVMRAWKNGQRILRQVRPFLQKSSAVLEVGAGIGATVKALEMAGYNASGIDPGAPFQQYGRDVLRSRVEKASLFHLPREPRYDLVLLIHVIEHFNSPARALTAIHGLLRPGGELYLECPNLAAPFSAPGHWFHFAHVYNFTPWTLLALARKCGFELQKWLSDDDNPNLRILLRRIGQGYLAVDPGGYERTLQRMNRYSYLGYHLRWSYWKSRVQTLFGFAGERLYSRRFVQGLSAKCHAAP
jgi:2-polyprenyl-3-methyl-5-hydroxy-6-metoxy-1,4-benzoquinol methylase